MLFRVSSVVIMTKITSLPLTFENCNTSEPSRASRLLPATFVRGRQATPQSLHLSLPDGAPGLRLARLWRRSAGAGATNFASTWCSLVPTMTLQPSKSNESQYCLWYFRDLGHVAHNPLMLQPRWSNIDPTWHNRASNLPNSTQTWLDLTPTWAQFIFTLAPT